MFLSFTIIVALALLFVSKTCVVVSSKEVCIVQRFGKFHKKLDPGFHLLVPMLDSIAFRHEMREQVIDIPPQTCTTRDNIQIEVDGVLYLKVEDAMMASYRIQNYRKACINLAQTTMRAEIGKLTLEKTFSEREAINANIVSEIDPASDPWGVKVLRYEIKNITPPHRVIDKLEKQMEAERQKRANILIAEAEKKMLVCRSEADRQEAYNLSEGAKVQRMNEAEGRAKGMTIVAEATAKGIERVGQAITRPGGSAALKMKLVDQFIDELRGILESSRVSVVPAELASMKGFFEGVGHVSSGVAGTQPMAAPQSAPRRPMPPQDRIPTPVRTPAVQQQPVRRSPPPRG